VARVVPLVAAQALRTLAAITWRWMMIASLETVRTLSMVEIRRPMSSFARRCGDRADRNSDLWAARALARTLDGAVFSVGEHHNARCALRRLFEGIRVGPCLRLRADDCIAYLVGPGGAIFDGALRSRKMVRAIV